LHGIKTGLSKNNINSWILSLVLNLDEKNLCYYSIAAAAAAVTGICAIIDLHKFIFPSTSKL
jgi:hypothetical protein